MWAYSMLVLFCFYSVTAFSDNDETGQKVNYTGYKLLQATPQTTENLKLLRDLDQQIGNYSICVLRLLIIYELLNKHSCKAQNLKTYLHRGRSS